MEHQISETIEGSVTTADNSTQKSTKSKMPSEGLHIPATFCPEGPTDPFATVEWDLRTAAIKGEGGEVLFEQHDCEIPADWSQLATNVVANKYFYGEVGTAERETSVRQLIHRVCRTIADWGIDDGYFATADDGERFYRDLTWLCLHQHASFNSPVWFNVGLYPSVRRQGGHVQLALGRARPARSIQPENPYEYPQALGLLHPERAATTWKTSWSWPAARPCSSSSARARAPTCRRCARTARSSPAAAGRRARCRSCGSTTRSRRWSRAAARPAGPPRCSRIKVWHPDVMEFIECKAREEREGPPADREGLRSARGLRLGPVPERQPLGPRERRVHAGRSRPTSPGPRTGSPTPSKTGPTLSGPRDVQQDGRSAPGAAAIPACSTTRRSTAGTPARTRGGSTPRTPA